MYFFSHPFLNDFDLSHKFSIGVGINCLKLFRCILASLYEGVFFNKKKIENSFDFLRGREKTRVSIFPLGTPEKLTRVQSRIFPGLKFIL